MAFLCSRAAAAVVAVRLCPYDSDRPVPWPAILEAIDTGLGCEGVEVFYASAMDEVLSPSFWEADAQSANTALWRWIDVAREYGYWMNEAGEPCSAHDAMAKLWQAVAADIRWVLDGAPHELRFIHSRSGEAPFWLTQAICRRIRSQPPGSEGRNYLRGFALTAPLPLLRLACSDAAGDALLETVASGRSLPGFLAGWLDVPRSVWRWVLRLAGTLPDMDPEEFRDTLLALSVIPRDQWPSSRSAWRDLSNLAAAMPREHEITDADANLQRAAILRQSWQEGPAHAWVACERLRGAAELLARMAEDGHSSERDRSRLWAMWRLMNVGKRRVGCKRPANPS